MNLYKSCEAMLRQAEDLDREKSGGGDELHHQWLVHPDGSKCEDGCDERADPRRVKVYRIFEAKKAR